MKRCVFIVLFACNNDPKVEPKEAGVTKLGSCDRVAAVSTCSEYKVSDETATSAQCGKLGGVFVMSECPNTSVIGACTMSTGEVRKFYSGGGRGYDVGKAQSECTSVFKGSWAAP